MELDDLRAACNHVKRDYLSRRREILALGSHTSCGNANSKDASIRGIGETLK